MSQAPTPAKDPIAQKQWYARAARYDATAIISSSPRLNFTITDIVTQRLQNSCGINVERSMGAGWEKALTRSIESVLERGDKYILFIDGDSVWSPGQLDKLYDLIENHTVDGHEIDAIFPVQCARNGEVPLAFAYMHYRIGPFDHSKPLTRVLHGHHGLTFVRTQCFRDMPRPWFEPVPGANGLWEQGRDADTSFWHKMGEADKVVACANEVSIGHIEAMVRVQDGPTVKCLPVTHIFENPAAFDDLRGPTIEDFAGSDDKRAPAPVGPDAESIEEQHQRSLSDLAEKRTKLPPRHDPCRPDKVIAFCLYGSDPQYVQGMLENIKLAPDIYPGWKVRVYCDHYAMQALTGMESPVEQYATWGDWTADGQSASKLKQTVKDVHSQAITWRFCNWGSHIDVELVPMQRIGRIAEESEGMFWRLFAAADERASHIIFRDADSRLNVREKAAVDAWIDSNEVMHVMRDHPHHARWAVMGGMWGIRGGVLPHIMEQILLWRQAGKGIMTRLYDQYFLASEVWPHLRHFALQHVGPMAGGGGVPFPKHEPWNGRHVGEQVQVAKESTIPMPIPGTGGDFVQDCIDHETAEAEKESRDATV